MYLKEECRSTKSVLFCFFISHTFFFFLSLFRP